MIRRLIGYLRWFGPLLALFIAAPAVAGEVRLNSGKSVDVFAVGPMYFTSGETALMLKYRTLLSIEDIASLRKEVDEIWERFVVDAEKANYVSAIVSANTSEHGFIVTKSKSYNFVFEKIGGTWRTLEAKDRTKLDAHFVHEFVDRVDWAYSHNNVNAYLLYLADDWLGTLTNPFDPRTSRSFGRLEHAALTRAALAKTKEFTQHREILDINVDDGGVRALVKSHSTEHGVFNDRELTLEEGLTDTVELRGEIMLITNTVGIIEKQTKTRRN